MLDTKMTQDQNIALENRRIDLAYSMRLDLLIYSTLMLAIICFTGVLFYWVHKAYTPVPREVALFEDEYEGIKLSKNSTNNP